MAICSAQAQSGNQGVGLALVAAVKGYAARIIMPDSCSEERRCIMEHYGAEVVLVHDEGDIGACIQECIALAASMAAEDVRVFVPQQFEHRDNVAAALRLAAKLGPGKTVVTLAPDTGERYFSTPLLAG